MKINKVFLILLCILGIFGIFTRLYKIETVPPHLSNDEISIAYDAYSINHTQKDEHGDYLPLSFRSHGTYKTPGYAYLLSPLYIFFNNNNTVARLPSITLGLLTVIVLGLIMYELTSNKLLSLISSILLVSSPWHIITSRMVLESNIALFFLSLGIFCFLRSVPKNKSILILVSIIFFSISMYCYHTQWVFSPIVLFLMLFLFKRKDIKTILLSLIIFFTLISPLIYNYFSNINTTARANTEIIWRGEFVTNSIAEHHNIFIAPFIIIKAVFEKYLEYTNFNYLFFNGSELLGKNHLYEQGLFLWPFFISFFVGIFYIKKNVKKQFYFFFILLVILSPIVSSLTHGSASLVRNLNSILPYTLIISIGLYEILSKKNFLKSFIYVSLVLLSFIYFFQIYMFHYPKEKAEGFQGYSPIAHFLNRDSKNYEHIYVDHIFGKNCQYIGVPHLYLAYYQKLDPSLLQNRTYTKKGETFEKYTITQIDWNNMNFNKKDLYVVSVCNPPVAQALDKIKLTTKIIDTSGNPAFEIWETK